MENKIINTKIVAEIALALKELNNKMVFVGGAVISLYTDDPAADEIRPTGDIDLAVQLAGFGEWTKLNERLLELGFSPNPEGNAICNYLYNGIEIDIMPSEDSSLGISNSWYKPGFSSLQIVPVENASVQILSAAYFLATKLEAFHDRGGDYRTSHDFEDIIYIIDNRTQIVEEILNADSVVKTYIKSELKKVLDSPYAEEYILTQIHPIMAEERLSIVFEKIKNIVNN